MQSAQELGQRFASVGELRFREEAGALTVVDIEGPAASASLCLQGAQILTWKPRGQAHDVVWLSNGARFAPAKSVRGGIPVCWPWFGPHALPGLPAHGFARNLVWDLADAAVLADGAVRVALRLDPHTLDQSDLSGFDAVRAVWPNHWELALHATFGDTLAIELVTRNRGATPFLVGEALHTYFRVGDVDHAQVIGLDGCEYVDKVGSEARRRQEGAVRFAGETDRVYRDRAASCVIDDPVLGRRIVVEKSASASTVVWTPWAEKAAKLGDFGSGARGADAGWREMLCVESANALEDCVTVAPGAEHRLAVRYRVEPRLAGTAIAGTQSA